ncbi:MAG TPA: VOC family protein [Novosphingobium sp.]|nr:VOC family protein [Novosphingobium sp.]
MISDTMRDGLMALRPAVPARDFARSRAFYEQLGFSVWPIGDALCHVQIGECDGLFCFLLQDAYTAEWAENSMLLLTVQALDPWWEHVSSLGLPQAFGVPAPIAPRVEPWGLRTAYFHDPSGVLWHLAEQRTFDEEA